MNLNTNKQTLWSDTKHTFICFMCFICITQFKSEFQVHCYNKYCWRYIYIYVSLKSPFLISTSLNSRNSAGSLGLASQFLMLPEPDLIYMMCDWFQVLPASLFCTFCFAAAVQRGGSGPVRLHAGHEAEIPHQDSRRRHRRDLHGGSDRTDRHLRGRGKQACVWSAWVFRQRWGTAD